MEKNSQIKTCQMPFMKQITKFSFRQYFPLYGTLYSLFVLQYSWFYMDQLELVRLQFMYFQYNVYLSIVVRTNIYKYI